MGYDRANAPASDSGCSISGPPSPDWLCGRAAASAGKDQRLITTGTARGLRHMPHVDVVEFCEFATVDGDDRVVDPHFLAQ